MWGSDHTPVHFHAEYARYKISIDIPTLEILKEDAAPDAGTWTQEISHRTHGELGIMTTQSIAKQNRSTFLAPTITADEPLSDVVALEVLDRYRLWVRFDDGVAGEVI